jgi:hypothetical protein
MVVVRCWTGNSWVQIAKFGEAVGELNRARFSSTMSS